MNNGPHIRTARPRRPFWLPASNYYVLAAAAALAFFFLAWGILHEGDETPWVTAGIGASIVLAGAVVLREVVMRRAMRTQAIRQKPLRVSARSQLRDRSAKLTVEQNAVILQELKQKSEAAKVLSKLSAGHREVFELCGEYLSRIENELRTVSAGSPRLAPLLRGRATASGFHRYHMLRWAEIEATSLTAEANTGTDVDARLRGAGEAMSVVEAALEHYPTEERLLASREVLREMAVSIRVTDLVERAEKATFRDDMAEAASLYRDALFYLGRDNVETNERRQAAERITAELERLRLPRGGR